MQIISKNLAFSLLDPQIITEKLIDDLLLPLIVLATQSYPFISSTLDLVPNPNKGFYHICHLSHLCGSSVNNFISKEVSNL